ncbi:hypothetical protein F0U60_21160 [Archangium minus]|uniref:Lipoprotein n=1 Tax=Archangium minus TaxID=83450 RepID=A0ABY9WUB2_9BACT|nr:hypothetical protein F0U61_21300 [Archangium violaceum]WNG46346.1 hypothetical protein F0U60_21160 [Archangium minus]
MGFAVGVLLATGCGPTQNEGKTEQQPSNTVTAQNTDDAALAQATLVRFTNALVKQDRETVLSLLSSEWLEKFERAEATGEMTDALGTFIKRERSKLIKSVGEHDSFANGLRATRVESTGNADVLAVSFQYEGKEIPRPIYFVREKGELRVNLVQPTSGGVQAQATAGNSNYKVQNHSNENDTASCRAYQGTNTVIINGYLAPNETIYMSCRNTTCDVFWDAGVFYYTESIGNNLYRRTKYTCDYNTWGTDFHVYGNSAHCEENCADPEVQ